MKNDESLEPMLMKLGGKHEFLYCIHDLEPDVYVFAPTPDNTRVGASRAICLLCGSYSRVHIDDDDSQFCADVAGRHSYHVWKELEEYKAAVAMWHAERKKRGYE